MLAPAGVGCLFAYAGLLGVMSQMPVLKLCEAVAGSRTVVIGGLILTIAFGAFAFMPGLTGYVLAATGFAFAGILLRPTIHAMVMEIAPARNRGAYTAALSVVSDLKDAAGPAVGTPLFAAAAIFHGLPAWR